VSVRGRIRLLLSVCEGVEHAHQKGIVHRDLKPANILVDPSGNPRVLDFGVAHATDSELTTVTRDAELIVGTLPYMSPEQLSGVGDADTRTDVYGLGVVAYELLGRCLPLNLEGKSIFDAAVLIRECRPAPLGSVNRALRGDLETIVGKALEKDKDQRYQSASQLASDLRRYLRNEPIAARPPSAFYQLQKLAMRHKALCALAALLLISLVAFAAVAALQADRVTRERDRAAEQAAIAGAVNRFVNEDLLASIDPERARGREVTVREILDASAAKIDGAFPKAPLVEASVRTTIGVLYLQLGHYQEAEPHLARALVLRRTSAPHHQETGDSIRHLAHLRLLMGQPAEAVELFGEALALRRRLLGPRHPRTLDTMGDQAVALRHDRQVPAAEALLTELLELQRQAIGANTLEVANTLNSLGTLHYEAGRHKEAEDCYRQSLKIRLAVAGEENLPTAQSLTALAASLRGQGRHDESKELLQRSLAIKRKVLGDRHPDTANTMLGLAGAFAIEGDHAAAEPLCADAVQILIEAGLPDAHPRLATARGRHGRCLLALRQFGPAEELLLKAYPAAREAFGQTSAKTREIAAALVLLYEELGDAAQTEQWRPLSRDDSQTAPPENP
jgi:tetratricopeptide (TPR) repeat protein